MTVALARDVEDCLENQIRSGVCADAGELVNDVLRSVREQQQKPSPSRPNWKRVWSQRRTSRSPRSPKLTSKPSVKDPHPTLRRRSAHEFEDFISDVELPFEWDGVNANWEIAEHHLDAVEVCCELLPNTHGLSRAPDFPTHAYETGGSSSFLGT